MIDINSPLDLLGNISPNDFMQNYWQKKPLLIKSSIANYKPIISKNQLFLLAKQEDIKSRLIQQNTKTKKWHVKEAPILSIPKTSNPWTLLVSNVNDFYEQINQFLQKFAFIPYARLDDVMISYANDGGSVGAHFDTYDVFLFQGMGQRKWQISLQTDLELIEDAPLKLLKNFIPEQEWVLEEGDMLYLPPQYAHHGIAIGECMTYSIGFRAPVLKDLVFEYFMDMIGLLEEYDIDHEIYTDPDQKATVKAGKIPENLVFFLQNTLNNLVMPKASHLLGTYLTKLNTDINPLQNPISLEEFKNIDNIELFMASKANYDDEYFYINGEKSYCEQTLINNLYPLADNRTLNIKNTDIQNNAIILEELYEWYTLGWVTIKL